MVSPVIIVPPKVAVDQVLRLMRESGSHSLVVDISADRKRGYGIVTTTDVYEKIVARDRDPSDFRAAEIMTAPIDCAEIDWTLRQASELMQEMGVHHLPVEDERAALVGVISASDIFIADKRGSSNLVS
jgi:CBS domain-containing protein